MKFLILIVSVALIHFWIIFLYIWYDHSERIQELVSTSAAEYYEIQPEWVEIKNEDPEKIAQIAKDSLIDLLSVFGGDFEREKRTQYKESLYDLIFVAVNGGNLEVALKKVEQKYQEWKFQNERFINNRFYSMKYTFY